MSDKWGVWGWWGLWLTGIEIHMGWRHDKPIGDSPLRSSPPGGSSITSSYGWGMHHPGVDSVHTLAVARIQVVVVAVAQIASVIPRNHRRLGLWWCGPTWGSCGPDRFHRGTFSSSVRLFPVRGVLGRAPSHSWACLGVLGHASVGPSSGGGLCRNSVYWAWAEYKYTIYMCVCSKANHTN
jgi:hypothetical protein